MSAKTFPPVDHVFQKFGHLIEHYVLGILPFRAFDKASDRASLVF